MNDKLKPCPYNQELEAFITDRIAEAMREANPNLGDKSFDRAKYYVDTIMEFWNTRKSAEIDEKKLTHILYGIMKDKTFKGVDFKLVMGCQELAKAIAEGLKE